jgi:hypothetical protein
MFDLMVLLPVDVHVFFESSIAEQQHEHRMVVVTLCLLETPFFLM